MVSGGEESRHCLGGPLTLGLIGYNQVLSWGGSDIKAHLGADLLPSPFMWPLAEFHCSVAGNIPQFPVM